MGVTPRRRFIVEDMEVCVVENGTPRTPRAAERIALQKYFALPGARDSETGRLWHILGEPIPGVDGAVLTYALPQGISSPTSPRQEEIIPGSDTPPE